MIPMAVRVFARILPKTTKWLLWEAADTKQIGEMDVPDLSPLFAACLSDGQAEIVADASTPAAGIALLFGLALPDQVRVGQAWQGFVADVGFNTAQEELAAFIWPMIDSNN